MRRSATRSIAIAVKRTRESAGRCRSSALATACWTGKRWQASRTPRVIGLTSRNPHRFHNEATRTMPGNATTRDLEAVCGKALPTRSMRVFARSVHSCTQQKGPHSIVSGPTVVFSVSSGEFDCWPVAGARLHETPARGPRVAQRTADDGGSHDKQRQRRERANQ